METMITDGANQFLTWVGFGTLVGLLAKAILPGKDPGGAIATVIIGIVGSIMGAGTLVFFSPNLRVTPISPIGFVVAIAGTSVILFCYRLLNGTILRDGVSGVGRWGRGTRRKISVTEK